MLSSTAKHVIIAAGANLPVISAKSGEQALTPAGTISRVISGLANKGFRDIRPSPVYRTPAFPAGSGPDYANAAVSALWQGSAAEALAALHALEAEAGRERLTRWGARVLDLDLIACDDLVLPDAETFARWQGLPPEEQSRLAPEELILPHPRLQDRAFVLVPAADVAPDWRHPVLGRTLRALRDALPPELLAEVRPWQDSPGAETGPEPDGAGNGRL